MMAEPPILIIALGATPYNQRMRALARMSIISGVQAESCRIYGEMAFASDICGVAGYPG